VTFLRVAYVQIAFRGGRDSLERGGRIASESLDCHFKKETPVFAVFQHPAVSPVHHPDGTGRGHRDSGGIPQLIGSLALASPLIHELARRGELLNPVVLRIGHQHIPVPVQGDSFRALEGAVGVPLRSPAQQVITVCVEFLNAMIPGVRHEDDSVGRNDDPRRSVKFAFRRAFRPPLGDKHPLLVKFHHPARHRIHDVMVSLGIHGDPFGREKPWLGRARPHSDKRVFHRAKSGRRKSQTRKRNRQGQEKKEAAGQKARHEISFRGRKYTGRGPFGANELYSGVRDVNITYKVDQGRPDC
jgi:hypothetical protein